MSIPLVLYHGGCWDGFCAAWVARKRLGEIEAVPVQYGTEPPDVAGRTVYILDFSYKRPVMREILSAAHFVTVLDHHRTAQAELADLVDEFTMRPDLIANPPGSELPVIRFDLTKSGGRLAWEYFFPGQDYPWLVKYTEDRDLWRWALPNSRAINAWLRSHPLDFEAWDIIGSDPGRKLWEGWIDEGQAILRREQQIIDEHVSHAREIELDGHKILSVNATVLFSDIAGELAAAKCRRCEGDGKAHGSDRPFESSGPGTYPGACPVCHGTGRRPFGACWFERQDGRKVWSLRSTKDGIDVSEVARRHGGGGHRNAAGFEE